MIDETKTTLNERGNWEVPPDLDTTDFDFDWRPSIYEPPFIHQFGTQHQPTGGPRYVVPTATDIKYQDCQYAKATVIDLRRWRNITEFDIDLTWHPDLNEPEPYIYQFPSSKWQPDEPGPRYIVPGARKTKYLEQPVPIIKNIDWDRWQIPVNIDRSSFDFTWVPPKIETEPFIYQFATQWQKTDGPKYVVPGATQIKYIDVQRARVLTDENISRKWRGNINVDFDFSWHPDSTAPPYIYQFPTLWNKHAGPRYVVPGAKETIYLSEPIAKSKSDTFSIHKDNSTIWQLPDDMSVIDDTTFDYNWLPPEEDEGQPFIYEFGTQWQKTGGPKYVVPGATQIKYVDVQRVTILPSNKEWFVPSTVEIEEFDFSWHPDATEKPYIYVFGNQLRRAEETPTAIYFTTGATQVKYINDLTAKVKYSPLDVIFISNGETGAEERYGWAAHCVNRPVKRVTGINSRELALVKAAEISDTDWFFVIPAKVKIDEKFNFDFQPNRFLDAKHYIFYARNPVNGLEYGHMAPVCYNRQLVLETIDYGLDFTMSQAHDIVPVIAGTAEYNSDPIMTWRTAFREVIKLMVDPTEENKQRLDTWFTVAEGEFSEWSIQGAKDGAEYFNLVNGDNSELMKTFTWSWLNEHFERLYPKLLTTK